MTKKHKESWGKLLLRGGYGAALGLHARLNVAAPSRRGLRIFYGGARGGDLGGTLVKIKRLQQAFPEHRMGYNLVYILSNAPYLPEGTLRLLKARGTPVVHNQNGVFYPAWYDGDWQAQNLKMARAYHLADHVFWQSVFCRRVADKFLGKRDGSGEILYNAIDTGHFRPAEAASRQTRSGRPFTFLITGKIDAHLLYRVEAGLRGLAKARARGLEARLVLAGWFSPETATRSRDLAESLDIADVVSQTGPYTQEEAPRIYQGADAYVMLKHNDPCPNAVLEAMACGLPVLYSATGGVPELVGGVAGAALACEEDWTRPRWPEPDAVAEGMLDIAANHRVLSTAARTRAVERFDQETWLARHRDIFERMLEERGFGRAAGE